MQAIDQTYANCFFPVLDCAQYPEDALDALDAGDALAFIAAARHGCELAMVFDNARNLKARGMYEKALLHAYTGCKGNNRAWNSRTLLKLFSFADAAALRAAGDPFPGNGPYTVYRGVSGTRGERKVRGLSWTADLDKACWFALGHSRYRDPAIYKARVTADDVFAYYNGRREQEFIVRPKRYERLPLSLSDIKAGDERVIAARQPAGWTPATSSTIPQSKPVVFGFSHETAVLKEAM
jgi:hypothetical protein